MCVCLLCVMFEADFALISCQMKIENKQIFDNLIRICCHKFQAKLTLTLLLIHSEYHGTSHCIAYVVIRCNNGYSVCALNVHQHHMPQRVPCASRATASNMRDRKTLSLGVHRARRQTHSFCVHMPYTNAYRIYIQSMQGKQNERHCE